MLRSLRRAFQISPEGVATINEIVGVVNQSIENARSSARGRCRCAPIPAGYHSRYVSWHAQSRSLSVDVTFRAEIWPEITLSRPARGHLYRIAQRGAHQRGPHGHAHKVDILLMVTPQYLSAAHHG